MKQNSTFSETDFEVMIWQLFPRWMNTPTGVLAWISIVLNIFVIITFLKIRKSKGKLPQGALQLLILAISEAAASVYWALGTAYFLFMENTSLSRNKTLEKVWLFPWNLLCWHKSFSDPLHCSV
jgi:hypothetical protein